MHDDLGLYLDSHWYHYRVGGFPLSLNAHVLILRSISFTGALLTRFFLGFVSWFMSLTRVRLQLESPDRSRLPFSLVHYSSYLNGINGTNWDYGPLYCTAVV